MKERPSELERQLPRGRLVARKGAARRNAVSGGAFEQLALARLHGSSPREQPNHDDDDRDHEQEVDEAAPHVKRDETQ
jgi:hypothetical protein